MMVDIRLWLVKSFNLGVPKSAPAATALIDEILTR